MKLMFFIIGQKINNLLLKTNEIFNYKIGIIGFLFYLIIFLLIKSPIASQINWNNWIGFILLIVFLLIDGLFIGYDYINVIKKLEKTNQAIKKTIVESNGNTRITTTYEEVTNPSKLSQEKTQTDYETTTELETTQEN